jgi:tetratricopeptide (TPR) repeat protein
MHAGHGDSIAVTRTSGPSAPATGTSGVALEETRVSVLRAEAPGGALSAALGRGAVIGRYIVLDRLGAGAMGVVYLAIDPELDRKVALKLLKHARDEPSGSMSEGARTRMIREAQALAKLSHPNVVAIYDVGARGDDVWIAMEFVEGETLRGWLGARRRGWSEVLALMEQVGRGMAAAHAAGLVHRDMKPDNVMIDRGGRARLMDFGLARADAGPSEAVAAGGGALSIEVTTAGAIIGTPAYMAPEQLMGRAAGASADLFALCVTFWEALYGARPFAGGAIEELRINVSTGRVLRPRRGGGAPRWLEKVLTRGLAAEPTQRWQSVAAMLDALERQKQRRKGLRALGLVGFVVGLGITGVTIDEAATRRKIASCEAEGRAIDEVLNEGARAQIERAFLATGKPGAAVIFEKTAPWLERWARSWAAAATEVCVASTVERRWDHETAGRARECLEEGRASFEALVAELAVADAITLVRATGAAAGVSTADGCVDPVRLRERPMTPPAQQAQVRALRAALAKVRSQRVSGHFAEALTAAEAALAEAKALGSPLMIAAAELEVGLSEKEEGAYVKAEASLLRALAAAREAQAPRIALISMMQLVWVVGDRGSRFAEGVVWAEAARTLLTLQLGSQRLDQAELENNLAQVYLARRSHAEALALQERALAGWREEFGPDHPTVAQGLNNLGNVRRSMGDFAGSIRLHQEALASRVAAFGEMHPLVAGSLSNLALATGGAGDLEGRIALDTRALEIREALLSADHPLIAESLNNLGGAFLNLDKAEAAEPLYARALAITESAPPERRQPRFVGTLLYNIALIRAKRLDLEGAAAMFERSRATFEAALGPEHLDLTYPMHGLMEIAVNRADYAEALALAQQILALREAGLGAGHPEVADALLGRATVRLAMGAGEEAAADAARALAIDEAVGGPMDRRLVEPLTALGEALLAAKRPAEAIAPLERALALDDGSEHYEINVAKARFSLAKALWEARGDRARSRSLAAAARERLRGRPEAAKTLSAVDVWVATHQR